VYAYYIVLLGEQPVEIKRTVNTVFICFTTYPKVSGLAAWSENCKGYSCLPLGAVASLFCESV